MTLLRFKMAQNRLLEVQGTGKSIKNGSDLFMVFSPTIAQHNGKVRYPESKHDFAGRSVEWVPARCQATVKLIRNNGISQLIPDTNIYLVGGRIWDYIGLFWGFFRHITDKNLRIISKYNFYIFIPTHVSPSLTLHGAWPRWASGYPWYHPKGGSHGGDPRGIMGELL